MGLAGRSPKVGLWPETLLSIQQIPFELKVDTNSDIRDESGSLHILAAIKTYQLTHWRRTMELLTIELDKRTYAGLQIPLRQVV